MREHKHLQRKRMFHDCVSFSYFENCDVEYDFHCQIKYLSLFWFVKWVWIIYSIRLSFLPTCSYLWTFSENRIKRRRLLNQHYAPCLIGFKTLIDLSGWAIYIHKNLTMQRNGWEMARLIEDWWLQIVVIIDIALKRNVEWLI